MDEIVGLAFEMNPVDMHPAWLDFFIGGQGGVLRDDVDLDTELDELFGEVVNVRADAADDARRIFPRQHHDAKHESL